MKKISKFVIILSIIFVLGFVLILLRGDEDTWICQNGSWVKHGNPSSIMPGTTCK